MSSTEHFTEQETERLRQLLGDPTILPQTFKDWVTDKVTTQIGAKLPLDKIRQANTLLASLAKHSGISGASLTGAYQETASLVIPGPGKAVVFYAGNSYNASGDYGIFGLEINGGIVDEMWIRTTARTVNGVRGRAVELPNPTNTVKVMVRQLGGGYVATGGIGLIVFRVGSA